jgi:dihydrofolate reductase
MGCAKELPMVEVTYSVAVSLDGFVARPELALDWLGPFMASGDDYTGAFIESMEVLIVGSHTYAESEQTMEWFGQGPCRSRPVYVLTSRELPLAGSNVTLTSASPARFVAELDGRGVARAGLLSGPSLLSSFRTAGLVTGYLLGIIPVVLGGGLRLFDSPHPPEQLRLNRSQTYENGVVQLRYEAVLA